MYKLTAAVEILLDIVLYAIYKAHLLANTTIELAS